jgi:hypothetical protein
MEDLMIKLLDNVARMSGLTACNAMAQLAGQVATDATADTEGRTRYLRDKTAGWQQP